MGPEHITFADARSKLEQDAYLWAVKEQQRMGCKAESLSVMFGSDCHDKDNVDDCIYSLFHDYKTGRTLLRRDWLNTIFVMYDKLINFEEVKRLFPKSTAHMLKNGVKLYLYYDGPNGGTTRKTNKKWHYIT